MDANLGRAEDISVPGIDVDKILVRPLRWRLRGEVDRCGITPLDFRFVTRAETFDVFGVRRKDVASTAGIKRIAANEFLLFRIVEILPSRQPGDRCLRDVVGEAWLAKQLRQIAIASCSVKMVAKVSAQLTAGVGDAGRPLPRTRVQHDLRSANARGSNHDSLRIDLNLTPGVSLDVGDAFCASLLVNQNLAGDGVGSEFEVPRLVRLG